MNIPIKICLIFGLASGWTHKADALSSIDTPIVSECMTQFECENGLPSGYICCSKNQTTTNYNCPTGWTLSGTKCTRANEDAPSDDTGYRQYVYGSCDASVVGTTRKCCWWRAKSSGGMAPCAQDCI